MLLVELIPPQKVVYASKPKFSHYSTSRLFESLVILIEYLLA